MGTRSLVILPSYDGESAVGNRYGRRVLEGDDRGFVYYTKFDTEAEAAEAFRNIARLYEALNEEENK